MILLICNKSPQLANSQPYVTSPARDRWGWVAFTETHRPFPARLTGPDRYGFCLSPAPDIAPCRGFRLLVETDTWRRGDGKEKQARGTALCAPDNGKHRMVGTGAPRGGNMVKGTRQGHRLHHRPPPPPYFSSLNTVQALSVCW